MVLSFFEIDDLDLDGMDRTFIKNMFIAGFSAFSIYILYQYSNQISSS